eukprot:1176062-Prorocentrum_minimum.AAC.1
MQWGTAAAVSQGPRALQRLSPEGRLSGGTAAAVSRGDAAHAAVRPQDSLQHGRIDNTRI